jgi:hypothetical protein
MFISDPEGHTPAPLIAFTCYLLDQALALVAAHAPAAAPAYAGPVGSHLRHVIEHLEALVCARPEGLVDYDSRRRDPVLEACPRLATERLLALQRKLCAWPQALLSQPVQVLGQTGAAGDLGFACDSSFGRELAFVASHTVHHFALLKPHCQAQGVMLGADFGKAPATLAHERAGQATANHPAQVLAHGRAPG